MWRTPRKKEVIEIHPANGLLLAHYEKGRSRICKEVPRLPNESQFDPYPPTELIEPSWLFHTQGLNFVGPINLPSNGYIWILVATKYFTKQVEAIPLRKATSGVMANFIKENIIVWFKVPHRIISDNGTPFVNKKVSKMLEFYQVKHHRSLPYYPQGNGQAKATNKTLIKIISKIS